MKINKKMYPYVTSQPFDVQELDNGAKVELHSMNQNSGIYNEYANKAKFSVWTSADGKNYRLLIEDGYYQEMRELYSKRVNQCWVDFWDAVEKGRGKIMKFVFLPLAIVILLVFVLLFVLKDQLGNNGQMIAMAVTLVIFVVGNIVINKKVDGIISSNNAMAVEKIKNIVGHKRFDELIDAQRVYYDKFFHIEEENNESTTTVEDETSEPLEMEALEEPVEPAPATEEETAVEADTSLEEETTKE